MVCTLPRVGRAMDFSNNSQSFEHPLGLMFFGGCHNFQVLSVIAAYSSRSCCFLFLFLFLYLSTSRYSSVVDLFDCERFRTY